MKNVGILIYLSVIVILFSILGNDFLIHSRSSWCYWAAAGINAVTVCCTTFVRATGSSGDCSIQDPYLKGAHLKKFAVLITLLCCNKKLINNRTEE